MREYATVPVRLVTSLRSRVGKLISPKETAQRDQQVGSGLLAVGSIGWEEVSSKDRITRNIGGSLLHFATAAAVAGVPPELVTQIPRDVASSVLPDLRNTGMGMRHVDVCEGKLPVFSLRYHEDEHLTFFAIEPASTGWNSELVDALGDALQSNETKTWVHVCTEVPELFRDLCQQAANVSGGVSAQIHKSMLEMDRGMVREALSLVDVVFSTESELFDLLDVGSMSMAGKGAYLGARPTYVATTRDTVTVIADQTSVRYRTAPIPAVDPTGAGDSFAGGYIAALLQERAPGSRVAQGMLCALACVSDFGPTRLLEIAKAAGPR